MSISTKYFNVDKNVLLEWTFNDQNLVSENYQILSNLSSNYKTFLSQSNNLNNLNNTVMMLDPVTNKFTKTIPANYNFLQVQDFFTSLIPYDTVRLYFPASFNFLDEGYYGLILNLSAYDYYNKNQCFFSQYFFDNQDSNRQHEIQLDTPFIYNSQQWSKYIEFKIPSIDFVSKQRTTTNDGSNLPTDNTINKNLTNGIGISDTTPIFIEFRFINNTQTVFGTKYYYTTSPYTTSISKTPDFMGLSCEIYESTQGDYFEINGTYAGSHENLDNYVNYLESRGQKIRIEYDVSLYEENILQRTQTFVVTENFAQTILYRPIITFSNTTAYIQVEMRIIDLISNSTDSRIASIGLTTNLFKYSSKLNRINIENAYTPIIYNLKSQTINNSGSISSQPTINTIKVNYPLLIEVGRILTGTISNSITSNYKGMGLLNIIINPYRNIFKFKIATSVDNNGNINPYDLSAILNNSKLTMVFKSDSTTLEKNLFYETDEIDFKNGIVVFSIEENDIPTIKKIREDNTRFYLTVKSELNNYDSRTLLYYGTFELLDNIITQDVSANNNNTSSSGSESITGVTSVTGNFGTNISENALENKSGTLSDSSSAGSTPILPTLQNLLLFIKANTNTQTFNKKLSNIVNYNTQVNTQYNFTYFIIGLTQQQITEIQNIPGVDKTVILPTDIGKNLKSTQDNSSQVTKLLDQANTIYADWLKTCSNYNPATGELKGTTSQTDIYNLIGLVSDIIKQLNSYGYKLLNNTNPIPTGVWMLVPDDGKGSFIPGYGYLTV